jgi:hypothetical protein
MSLLFSLIAHLLVTFARLAKLGGLGAVLAGGGGVAGGQTTSCSFSDVRGGVRPT